MLTRELLENSRRDAVEKGGERCRKVYLNDCHCSIYNRLRAGSCTWDGAICSYRQVEA